MSECRVVHKCYGECLASWRPLFHVWHDACVMTSLSNSFSLIIMQIYIQKTSLRIKSLIYRDVRACVVDINCG